jgi:hypothetical protein
MLVAPSKNIQALSRTLDSSLRFESTELVAALGLWESKRIGNELPARSDFSHDDFRQFMGNIVLVDVETDPRRYRYRLIGSNVTELVERDMTGRYLDDIYGEPDFRKVVHSFSTIMENRQPIRGYSDVSHARKGHIHVEVLDAPLASDGVNTDMIIKFVSQYWVDRSQESPWALVEEPFVGMRKTV